jgi:OFA family oxalate/formate antiporter-like MFS transporter
LPTSVFGRQGYETVNSVVFPIQSGITALCFLIDGYVLGTTGELRYTFLVFAIIALLLIIPLLMTEDHKYNLDWQAGEKAGQ